MLQKIQITPKASLALPAIIAVFVAVPVTYFVTRASSGVVAGENTNREGITTNLADTGNLLDDGVLLQDVTIFEVGQFSSPRVPVKYTAIVSARRKSQLAFLASERISEVLVHEGDQVYAGQTLARQEQAALKAQVAMAEAVVLETKARLAERLQGPREQTIGRARAIVEQRKSELDVAQASLNRYEKLIAVKSTSEEEYDDARFRVESNRAAFAAAEQELAELEAGTRQEQIDASKANAAAAVAELERLKTRLEQTELKAPFNGRISNRMLDEGALPAPSQAVLEIIESDMMEVRFGADPSIAKQIALDDTIQFECLGERFTGVVNRKQPILDSATRTQDIVLSVAPEDSRKLLDGVTANVEFAKEQNTNGYWVPTRALVPQVRGLWSVFVATTSANVNNETTNGQQVNARKTQRRDVELLATWGNWSQVRGTLEKGELVILDGANRISEGQFVRSQSIEIAPPWMLANQIGNRSAAPALASDQPVTRNASLVRKRLTEKAGENEN